MRTTLLDQIKTRRKALKVRSSDMPLLAGINRQQYERIEKCGNPSLSTLDKISEALDAELMLIPKEKLRTINRFLEAQTDTSSPKEEIISAGVRVTFQESFLSDREGSGEDYDNSVVDPWSSIEEKK